VGAVLRRDGRPITESAISRVLTTPAILAEEQHIAVWAQQRLARPATAHPASLAPAQTDLDHAQLELAAAVAGDAPLVLARRPGGHRQDHWLILRIGVHSALAWFDRRLQ